MPVLTIRQPEGIRRIEFSNGRSIRDILDETDIRVRAACNGMGACGLCQIKISGNTAGKPSGNELTILSPATLSRGVRLACQVIPHQDLEIEILNQAPPSAWHSIEAETDLHNRLSLPLQQLPAATGTLGMSVDLGTTHISITISDIHPGRRITGRRGLNPQVDSGADVLTRLVSAKSEKQAKKLQSQVLSAISDGLRDISSRDGIDLRRITRATIVGNTAMIALLSGQNHRCLLEPRYWTEFIECRPLETSSWCDIWGIGEWAAVEVIPPLAGFVGSDLLAGIIATGLTENGPGALLIDFGTNSEMALWDGNTLWVTSAAGGPAFEGCGISCGMPAEPGAIFGVQCPGSGELKYDVIAGAEPKGLCGSGLVDLLACLVGSGTINSKGQFSADVPSSGFLLQRGDQEILLSKGDIDVFQRAKGAIGVGLDVLLSKAEMSYTDLRRICIGGVFGKHLNISNAQAIGLLPAVSPDIIETLGNTALLGCETLLLSNDGSARLQNIRNRASIVNLSSREDFDMLFLDHLHLRPVQEVLS